MGIRISSQFDLRSQLSLDSRFVRGTLADRDLIQDFQRYEGLMCFVQEDGFTWQLVGGITNAHWQRLGTGSIVRYNFMNQSLLTILGVPQLPLVQVYEQVLGDTPTLWGVHQFGTPTFAFMESGSTLGERLFTPTEVIYDSLTQSIRVSFVSAKTGTVVLLY